MAQTLTKEHEAQALPEDNLDAIVAEIESLESELSALNELADQEPGFDEKLSAELQAHSDEEAGSDDWQKLYVAMRNVSQGPVKEYIEIHFEKLLHNSEKIEALNEKADELAKKEWEETQAFFTNQVDWESIIRDELSSEEEKTPISIEDVTALLTKDVSNSDYRDLEPRLQKMRALKESLIESGYTFKEPLELLKQNDQFTSSEFQEVTDKWLRQTSEAYGLLGLTRRIHLKETLSKTARAIDQFGVLIEQAEYVDSRSHTIEAVPVISDAIQRLLAETLNKVDETDEAFIRHESKLRPSAPLVTGLQYLKESTGLDDPNSLVYRCLNRYPEWFTAGLGFIKFRKEPEETENETLRQQGFAHRAGITRPIENEIEIDSLLFSYTELIEQNKKERRYTTEEIQNRFKGIISSVLVHELAHYGHFQKLPLSWLRRWVDITRYENVAITEYAKASLRAHQGEIVSNQREDLADSLTAYINKPLKLIRVTPERFKLIQELFKIYPQKNIDAIIQLPENDPERVNAELYLLPPDEVAEVMEEYKALKK